MNEHPSPEFEKEIRESFDASHANPEFVRELRASLLERTKMKNRNRSFIRLTWTVGFAALLIIVFVASPRVVTALKQLFGYVPGIGYVEQGNFLRLLSAPVSVEKNGVTLIIEKGAADSQQTVLLQRIEGYTFQEDAPLCDTPAQLVLLDGTVLNLISFEATHEGDKGGPASGSYYSRNVFEALPAQTLEATLQIPCIMYNDNYPDWQVELQFEYADEEQIVPVIELPSDTPPTDLTTTPPSSTEIALEGFTIVLESEASLPDGYIITGSYQWTDPRFAPSSTQPSNVQITDANGIQVNFKPIDPMTRNDEPSMKRLPFAFEIIGKDYTVPFTISVKSIVVRITDTATFQFDAGANPQVGQAWNVNVNIPINEYDINIQTIELISGETPTQLGFRFTVDAQPAIAYLSILDLNPIFTGNGYGGGGGGGGGGAEVVDTFTTSWVLDNYSPAGVKTFAVSNIGIFIYGTWQVSWQPKQ